MNRAVIAALAVVAAAAVVAGIGGAADAEQDASAEIVSRYPADDGEMVEETVVGPADVASVEAPQKGNGGGWQVPMELTDEAAERFAGTLTDAGFTSEGVQSCPSAGERNDDGYCLLTVVDGEVVNALGVGPSFADVVESGEFADDPRFVLSLADEETAEEAAEAFGWQQDATTGDETTDRQTTSVDTTTAPADTTGTDESDGSAPGTGVVGAIAAVVAGAAIARRG